MSNSAIDALTLTAPAPRALDALARGGDGGAFAPVLSQAIRAESRSADEAAPLDEGALDAAHDSAGGADDGLEYRSTADEPAATSDGATPGETLGGADAEATADDGEHDDTENADDAAEVSADGADAGGDVAAPNTTGPLLRGDGNALPSAESVAAGQPGANGAATELANSTTPPPDGAGPTKPGGAENHREFGDAAPTPLRFVGEAPPSDAADESDREPVEPATAGRPAEKAAGRRSAAAESAGEGAGRSAAPGRPLNAESADDAANSLKNSADGSEGDETLGDGTAEADVEQSKDDSSHDAADGGRRGARGHFSTPLAGNPLAAPVAEAVPATLSGASDGSATRDAPNPNGDPAGATTAPAAPDASHRAATALSRLAAERSIHAAAPTAGDDGAGAVDRTRFVGRVEGAIRAAHGRDGRVQVRLSPPELGALRIELTVQHGVLSARLEAETPAARNLLLDSLPALRERLAQQDVRVERFDVDLRQDASGGGSGQNPAQDRAAREPAWRPEPNRSERVGQSASAGGLTTPRVGDSMSEGAIDVRV